MAGVAAIWRPLGHGRTGQETKERPGGDSRLAAKGTRAPLSPPGGGSYRAAPRGLRLGTRGTRLLPSPARRGEPPVARQREQRLTSDRASRYHREPGGSSRVAVRGRNADLPGDREERNRECHFGRRRGDDDGHDGSHLHDRVGAPGLQIRSTHDHRAVQRRDRRCEAGAIECYADRSGQPLEASAGPSPPDARMSTMRRSNASRGVSADPHARAGEDER